MNGFEKDNLEGADPIIYRDTGAAPPPTPMAMGDDTMRPYVHPTEDHARFQGIISQMPTQQLEALLASSSQAMVQLHQDPNQTILPPSSHWQYPGISTLSLPLPNNGIQHQTMMMTYPSPIYPLMTAQTHESMVATGSTFSHNDYEVASQRFEHCAIPASRQQESFELPISNHPTSLSIPSDSTFLDPTHNFLRCKCIEVFVATKHHMTAPGRGARPTKIGQVGLRCIHCKDTPCQELARQAVCFPSKRETIFESVRNYRRYHFPACPQMPDEMKGAFDKLNLQDSIPTKPQRMVKAYYTEAAADLGLVNTPNGLMFGSPPNDVTDGPSERLSTLIRASESPSKFAEYQRGLSSGKDEAIGRKKFEHVASIGTRRVIINARNEPSAFVYPQDFPTIADIDFLIFHQFTCCKPTPSALKLKGLDAKDIHSLSGLFCKHCARANAKGGEIRRNGMYFPTTVQWLNDSSFSQTVLTHLMGCPHVPAEIKNALDELKHLAADYGVTTKRGSRMKFFKNVWARMENYYK